MADAMLRDRIKSELKDAMKAREARKTATLRLISAAQKERDIAARSKGVQDGV